jgi:hypothetical protein
MRFSTSHCLGIREASLVELHGLTTVVSYVGGET